ncbi:MAG: Rid family detoxifying hydrolase [Candidatus Eiseniibacteriota bacterium]
MHSTVQVKDAPAAVGPYSQARIVQMKSGDRMAYTAGQVGLDPATGTLVAGGVREQTEQVFRNLSAVLRGAQMTLADVVKTTVFLVDMADFASMNEMYARNFPAGFPARSTVAVAGLPLGARVEIEVVAIGAAP